MLLLLLAFAYGICVAVCRYLFVRSEYIYMDRRGDLMYRKFIAFMLTIESDGDYNRNGDALPNDSFFGT